MDSRQQKIPPSVLHIRAIGILTGNGDTEEKAFPRSEGVPGRASNSVPVVQSRLRYYGVDGDTADRFRYYGIDSCTTATSAVLRNRFRNRFRYYGMDSDNTESFRICQSQSMEEK